MKRLLVLLALLAGCQGFDRIPNQDLAEDIIWRRIYGELRHDPPYVEWIRQHNLDCKLVDGVYVGFYRGNYYGDPKKSTQCVAGVTWDWGYPIVQTALPEGWPIHKTALAHEFWHAFLRYSGGDGDPNHEDPGFGINSGHKYGEVDAANDALEAEGL